MKSKISEKEYEKIKDLYTNENLSSTQIGKILNISHKTVLNYLEKAGIKRRNLNESHFARNNKIYPKEFYDYEFMYNMYINLHMTKEEIGKYFNCAPHVIDRVLKKLNIHVRNSSESKIGVQKGEKHHNWKGGVSSLNSRCREYFQKNISPKIRERDGYKCCLCGNKSNLHVHHIIPFSDIIKEILSENKNIKDEEKLYDIVIKDKRFLDEKNLITYCKDCHLFIIHKYNKTTSSQA